jgi:hypothetical protein
MTLSKSLTALLVTLLPIGVLAPACAPSESTTGQLITCATDPGTGVILTCEPSDGTPEPGHCTDVDEDGDGEPSDSADDDGTVSLQLTGRPDGGGGDDDGDGHDADDDHDGVPDDEDCDHHPGEDHDGDDGDVDLPYDIRLAVGQTTTPIHDAFAAKGAQPASIVSITGAAWRLTELQAGTPFTVTQADCTHAGNRDVGRDRVVVTWKNADNSTHSDHLDLRYCK